MLYESIFKCDTIRTDDIGVGNEVVFCVFVADSHGFVPDLFRDWGGGLIKTGDDHAENCCDYQYDGNDTNDFAGSITCCVFLFHGLLSFLDIFR